MLQNFLCVNMTKETPKKSSGIQKFSNFSLLPYDFMLQNAFLCARGHER